MRKAIASAEVGDAVIDTDPTVERLERSIAQILGKDAQHVHLALGHELERPGVDGPMPPTEVEPSRGLRSAEPAGNLVKVGRRRCSELHG